MSGDEIVLVYYSEDETMTAYNPNVETLPNTSDNVLVLSRGVYPNASTGDKYTGALQGERYPIH